MTEIVIEHNAGAAARTLARYPSLLREEMRIALDESAELVLKAASDNADQLSVTRNLAGSIHVNVLEEWVRQIAPGIDYAVCVERGTKPGYKPNLGSLIEYLRSKVRVEIGRFDRLGSKKRLSQEAEIEDRAGGLMTYIRRHGTKPHPFMAPAAESTRDRVIARLRAGAARAAQRGRAGE
jgi:hypothetical protein